MKRSMTAAIIWALGASLVAAEEPKFSCVDLEAKFTHKLSDKFGDNFEGNLLTVPKGEQTFEKIKFKIGEGVVQLGSKMLPAQPEKVEGIKVERKFAKLHILHANCFGGGPSLPGSPLYVEDDTKIGEYKVNYEDKSAEYVPIVFGKDVRDWWFRDDEKEPSRGLVAWKGENDPAKKHGCKLRLYLSTWKNPKPDMKVISVDYIGQKEATVAAPFCAALTLEEK
jgi:hypothetical protein